MEGKEGINILPVVGSGFCKQFSDSEILNIAYLFYFADEDAPDGKVWKYMNAMRVQS